MAVSETAAPPAAQRADRVRYLELEAYRGVAAVLVVIFHAYQYAGTGPYLYQGHPLDRVLHQLDGTVAWFLLLSGFLIFLPVAAAALGDAPRPSARGFLVRRAVRILPLYWIAVSVVWTLRNPRLPGDWRDLVEHLTFTQVYDNKRIFYTIGGGWSLCVEITFYAFIALLIPLLVVRLPRLRSRASRVVVLVGVAGAILAASAVWKIVVWAVWRVPTDRFTAYFSPIPRADTFAMGMLLAVAVAATRGRNLFGREVAVGLRLLGAAVLVYAVLMRPVGNVDNPWFNTLCGLGILPVIASSVMGPRGMRWERVLSWRPLSVLGVISYSLYIWHEPILLQLATWHVLFTRHHAFVTNALELLALSLAFAWASYWVIEYPAGWLKELFTGDGRWREYYVDLPDVIDRPVGGLLSAASAPDQDAAAPVTAPSTVRSRGSVLVVDDDPALRELLAAALAAADFSVATAADGRTALDRLAEAAPDLIVSDVTMPEMDGFALAGAVRDDRSLDSVPILFLTTRSATTDVVTGLSLGADDYLTKPVDLGEFVSRVAAKVARPTVPLRMVETSRSALSPHAFAEAVEREWDRFELQGTPAVAALLTLPEAASSEEVDRVLRTSLTPLDAACVEASTVRVLLAGGTDDGVARLLELGTALVADRVESRPFEGSSFDELSGWLEASRPSRPGPLPHGVARLLLVDDDEVIRQLYGEALRLRGYEVAVAASGEEALHHLATRLPDLVISDVSMPGLSGYDLVGVVRADPRLRNVPLLLMTTQAATQDVVEGLEGGADDYLIKPVALPELVARIDARLERRAVAAADVPVDRATGLLTEGAVLEQVALEQERMRHGGASGALAHVRINEVDQIRLRLGPRAMDGVARQLAPVITDRVGSLDWVGRDSTGAFAVVLSGADAAAAEALLRQLAHAIAGTSLRVAGQGLRVTPSMGWSELVPAVEPRVLLERAALASAAADVHLDLVPVGWTSELEAAAEERLKEEQAARRTWRVRLRRLTVPFQIGVTLVVGLIAPFFVYWLAADLGFDLATWMYLAVVVALLVTGALIWIEGLLALPRADPPEFEGAFPPASAIIAAYLPNEAATILDTVEAFLAMDYAAPLQVIVAYNTPRDLPVEAQLRAIAAADPRLVPFRVEGSTSKAQNVNAALALVTGAFVGVFDADHKPLPNSFSRAWRWIADGADVVQGHSVVRNGEASWVARLVAVEFEAIYAVSHPGRARLHRFGIFGGSNGYWRSDLLRETRMRGSMLTEDIDSALRVVERGGRIVSDPYLVSRELATTTLGQLWNQRNRWAQGWFQVSLRHFLPAMRSRSLTPRQKLGFFHLLAWREFYPWLSLQMFPIIAYWTLIARHRLNWFVPVFVLTTLFTLGVGPGQTLFAWRLSAPEIRRRGWWFLFYLLVASLFYTEYKNIIARVAQVKEAMHERQWKVTPRSASAGDSGD